MNKFSTKTLACDFFPPLAVRKTLFPKVCCEAGGIKPEGILEIQLLMHLYYMLASLWLENLTVTAIRERNFCFENHQPTIKWP